MPPPPLIDWNELHWLLWDRADRRGRLRVVARTLASELVISKQAMSRLLQTLERQGRIRRVSVRPQPHPVTYEIVNPETYEA